MSDTDVTQIQGPRDLFSIRSQLAQQANPLRAKIVLFSLLYRPFSYNSGDWSTLKQQDLGEFIRRVYNKYATLEELKRALTIATAQLDAPNECDHAAAAIYKVLKPYYTEVEPVTGDLVSFEADDADNSQTWDIPIGVSLKDLDREQDSEQTDTQITDVSTEIDRSSISSASDLPTTGLTNATTMALFDTETDVDAEDDFADDSPMDDHSRWLDSFNAETGAAETGSDAMASQSQPAIEQRKPKDSVTSDPLIVATANHNDAEMADPESAQASPEPPNQKPPRQKNISKRNGRRTALAQLLTQHVNSRDEVDAIVQRYSKTLTEQVTSALDDLEDELAECLADRDADEATQMAGEALGRVLLSVSESIDQMRQALESIPGVEPIANDWPQTRPPQVQPSQTQAPQTQPPQTSPTIDPAIATSPITSETSTPPVEAAAAAAAMADVSPRKPNQPDKPEGAIDPVQRISHQFETILAKRDMSVVVKQRDGCIHIIAEANPLPERAKLIRFISKTLKNLDLPPIASLRLHGRRTGARAFDWSEDLPPIA